MASAQVHSASEADTRRSGQSISHASAGFACDKHLMPRLLVHFMICREPTRIGTSLIWSAWRRIFGGLLIPAGTCSAARAGKPRCRINSIARSIGMRTTPLC